ncbi:hypothetical protein ACQKNS_23330 [Peribacillus sp. NPDC094092]
MEERIASLSLSAKRWAGWSHTRPLISSPGTRFDEAWQTVGGMGAGF